MVYVESNIYTENTQSSTLCILDPEFVMFADPCWVNYALNYNHKSSSQLIMMMICTPLYKDRTNVRLLTTVTFLMY